MRKELIELRQDPKLFGVLFIAPIVQLVVLGYAATTDVTNVPIVIADGDRTSMSRALISQFEGSPYFTVAGTVTTMKEIDDWLEQGRAWIAVGIPADYQQLVGAGRPAIVQVIADGTDSNSTNAAMNYAQQLVAQSSTRLSAQRAGLAAAPAPAIEARVRVWFNPQLESRTFMIPGIVAMLLLVITTNLSSMALVRERELGTLEQLNVTPLARWQLILGKLLPYGLLGMVDVVLVVFVALIWFRIPLLGSPLLLFVCCLIYLLTTLGLGLFISTVSEDTAAVDDDRDVLLPDADALPLGFHLPDREHAGLHPEDHVPRSPPLLHHHRPRHLPEGRGCGRAVAGHSGSAGVGPRHHRPRRPAIAQDHGIGRGNLFWVH